MLGGTVGNLDSPEEEFFDWMRSLLGLDDMILLDVPLAGPAWTPGDEPRLKHEGYSKALRQFLTGPMEPSMRGGAEAEFDRRVSLSYYHSAVPGAEVIEVHDARNGRLVLRFRRYRWDSVLDWFRSQGFAVEFARSSLASESDRFGMGVVLMSRSSTAT
jgi:hypothetical protein